MSELPPCTARYVVLHHTGIAIHHFDLMIEVLPGEPLWTWRLPSWPISDGQQSERLCDHRPMYLDYEGPISGNRGSVRRIASGTCTFEIGSDRLRVRMGESLMILMRGAS